MKSTLLKTSIETRNLLSIIGLLCMNVYPMQYRLFKDTKVFIGVVPVENH